MDAKNWIEETERLTRRVLRSLAESGMVSGEMAMDKQQDTQIVARESMRVAPKQALGASAMQWTQDNLKEMQAFLWPASPLVDPPDRRPESTSPLTLGVMASVPAPGAYDPRYSLTFAKVGDWVVKWDSGVIEVLSDERVRLLFEVPAADATGSPA